MIRLLRVGVVALGVGLVLLLVAAPWLQPAPAGADELPPDQPRKVVFELFTPPVVSGGGG